MDIYDDHPGKGRVPVTGWVPPAGSRAEYLLRMEREATKTAPYTPTMIVPGSVQSPTPSSAREAVLTPIPTVLPTYPGSPTSRASRTSRKATSEPSASSLLIVFSLGCWGFVAFVSGILKAAFLLPEEQATSWAITALVVLIGLALAAAVVLALWTLICAMVEWAVDHKKGLTLAVKIAFHAGLFGCLVTRLVAAHSAVVTWLGMPPSAITLESVAYFFLAAGLLHAALWFGGRAVLNRRAWLLRGTISLIAKAITRPTNQEFVRIEPAFSGDALGLKKNDFPGLPRASATASCRTRRLLPRSRFR
jgi:hypothetical protein